MLAVGKPACLYWDTYQLLVDGSWLDDTRTIKLHADVLRWVASEVVIEKALAAYLALGERHYADGNVMAGYGELPDRVLEKISTLGKCSCVGFAGYKTLYGRLGVAPHDEYASSDITPGASSQRLPFLPTVQVRGRLLPS